MITTIQKWGNSQGVRIPKTIMETMNWASNEPLLLSVENDKIILQKAERRKNIVELFAGFEDGYTSEEVDWGKPVVEEVW